MHHQVVAAFASRTHRHTLPFPRSLVLLGNICSVKYCLSLHLQVLLTRQTFSTRNFTLLSHLVPSLAVLTPSPYPHSLTHDPRLTF